MKKLSEIKNFYLLRTSETYISSATNLSVPDVYETLLPHLNWWNQKRWKLENYSVISYSSWLRGQIPPPSLKLHKKDNNRITIQIEHDACAQRNMVRLFIVLFLSYGFFVVTLILDHTYGDGLYTLTVNGKESLVPLFPSFAAFLMAHGALMMLLFAGLIKQDRQRSRKIAHKILAICE